MKKTSILFISLALVFNACKKEFSYPDQSLPSCTSCARIDSLVGIYRGDATGIAVPNDWHDSATVTVSQYFFEKSPIEDSTRMYVKVLVDYDHDNNNSNSYSRIYYLPDNSTNGLITSQLYDKYSGYLWVHHSVSFNTNSLHLLDVRSDKYHYEKMTHIDLTAIR